MLIFSVTVSTSRIPPFSVAFTFVAEPVTVTLPCALFAVSVPSIVPTFTAPLLFSTVRSPVSESEFTLFAFVIVALPTPFTVAFSATSAAVKLPPFSVAFTFVAEPVTVTSPCALFAVSVPSIVPTFIAPLLFSTVRSPVSESEFTLFAFVIVALPTPFTVAFSATSAAVKLPPFSVAFTFVALLTFTSASALPAVNVPSIVPTFTAPLLCSTVRFPFSSVEFTAKASFIVASPSPFINALPTTLSALS